MHIEPAWDYSGLKITVSIPGEPQFEPYTEQHPAQFVREADHFADCILQNKEPHTPGEEGLQDVKLITDIYRSCGRKG